MKKECTHISGPAKALMLALTGCLAVLSCGCGKAKTLHDVSASRRDWLLKVGLLATNETILEFVVPAGITEQEKGVFYTDRRVAEYWSPVDPKRWKVQPYTWFSEYPDVTNVSPWISSDPLWGYMHGVVIESAPAEYFRLHITADKRFARGFAERLSNEWRRAQSKRSQ